MPCWQVQCEEVGGRFWTDTGMSVRPPPPPPPVEAAGSFEGSEPHHIPLDGRVPGSVGFL